MGERLGPRNRLATIGIAATVALAGSGCEGNDQSWGRYCLDGDCAQREIIVATESKNCPEKIVVDRTEADIDGANVRYITDTYELVIGSCRPVVNSGKPDGWE